MLSYTHHLLLMTVNILECFFPSLFCLFWTNQSVFALSDKMIHAQYNQLVLESTKKKYIFFPLPHQHPSQPTSRDTG